MAPTPHLVWLCHASQTRQEYGQARRPIPLSWPWFWVQWQWEHDSLDTRLFCHTCFTGLRSYWRRVVMSMPSSWPWNSCKIDDLWLHYNEQSKLFSWPTQQSYTPTQGYILTSKNSGLSWLIDWQCSGIAFTGTCGSPIQIKWKAICYNRLINFHNKVNTSV